MMGFLMEWIRQSHKSTLTPKLKQDLSLILKAHPRRTVLYDEHSDTTLVISKIGLVTVIDQIDGANVREVDSDFNLGAQMSTLTATRFSYLAGSLSKYESTYGLRKVGDDEYEHVGDPPTLRQALRGMSTDIRLGLMYPTHEEAAELIGQLTRAVAGPSLDEIENDQI